MQPPPAFSSSQQSLRQPGRHACTQGHASADAATAQHSMLHKYGLMCETSSTGTQELHHHHHRHLGVDELGMTDTIEDTGVVQQPQPNCQTDRAPSKHMHNKGQRMSCKLCVSYAAQRLSMAL